MRHAGGQTLLLQIIVKNLTNFFISGEFLASFMEQIYFQVQEFTELFFRHNHHIYPFKT